MKLVVAARVAVLAGAALCAWLVLLIIYTDNEITIGQVGRLVLASLSLLGNILLFSRKERLRSCSNTFGWWN